MERLTLKTFRKRAYGFRQSGRFGFETGAIVAVADQRIAYMAHMDANLMGAASLQPAGHKRGEGRRVSWAETLADLPMGDRRAPAGFHHRYLLAVVDGSGQIRVDRAFKLGGRAPSEGRIGALKGAAAAVVRELRRQALMDTVGFRHHKKPGRVFVQPVDDARTFNAANAGEAVGAMVDQRVDERAVPIARARMHHQTCGFIDHNQVIVFKGDVERNILAFWGRGFRLRQCEKDYVACVDPVLWLKYFAPAYGCLPLFDQGLYPAAAHVRHRAREKRVDAGARIVNCHYNLRLLGRDIRRSQIKHE